MQHNESVTTSVGDLSNHTVSSQLQGLFNYSFKTHAQ